MSNLTYLNDASVLYNLKQRYYHKLIYVSQEQSRLEFASVHVHLSHPKPGVDTSYTPDKIETFRNRNRNIAGKKDIYDYDHASIKLLGSCLYAYNISSKFVHTIISKFKLLLQSALSS